MTDNPIAQESMAIVLQQPQELALKRVSLSAPGPGDLVVDICYSGISTGTEKLLWSGRMPQFPGMGYPLIPGYESVGRVVHAPDRCLVHERHDPRIPGYESVGRVVHALGTDQVHEGDFVFVPGAKCFGDIKGLFGGAASRVVIPEARVVKIPETLGERGVLLALAATAHHVYSGDRQAQPDLIIGHGVLGRLMARLAVVAGHRPVVWETNETRRHGAAGYDVVDPSTDSRRDYKRICDVSGDSRILDTLIARLGPGGEIALAGFYDDPLSFVFPPAFMREARFRIAAQWQPSDLQAVSMLAASGELSLDDLITHHSRPTDADAAYRTAFQDPDCLKMVLDWRQLS